MALAVLKSTVTLTRTAAVEYWKCRGFMRGWEERRGRQEVEAKQ